MSKPMTAREFVFDERCPACGTHDLEWGSITVEGNTTHQEVHCEDCGLKFATISRLVGYCTDPDWEPVTIKEDFAEVTSAEEPPDPLYDELLHANTIINALVRRVRDAGDFIALPPLRRKERAAVLRKEKP